MAGARAQEEAPGPLLDVLTRLQAAPAAPPLGKKRVFKRRVTSVLAENVVNQGAQGFGVDLAYREALESRLQRLISRVGAEVSEDPPSHHDARSLVARHVSQLVLYQRQHQCLKHEVKRFLGDRTHVGSREHRPRATSGFPEQGECDLAGADATQSWLGGLWEQYHCSPRGQAAFRGTITGDEHASSSEVSIHSIKGRRSEKFANYLSAARSSQTGVQPPTSDSEAGTSDNDDFVISSRVGADSKRSHLPRARKSSAMVPHLPVLPRPSKQPPARLTWRGRAWRQQSPRGDRKLAPPVASPELAADPGYGLGGRDSAPSGKVFATEVDTADCEAEEGLKLPLIRTFVEPWRCVEAPPPVGNMSTKRYLRACEKYKTMPRLMPFVTGSSPRLNVANRGLMDRDLLAFAAVVRSGCRLEEVDLQDNTLLTEKGLVPFVQRLFGEPASSSLRAFSLKRCFHSGNVAQIAIVELISKPEGARNLQRLDLSGIPMGTVQQVALCKAIAAHPTLTAVHIADIGLGAHAASKKCVGELLHSRSLRVLDVSWNVFSAEVFQHLGECLVRAGTLISLAIANCTTASDLSGVNPVEVFIESLAVDRVLQRLDISLNRLGPSGALVLEDALESRHQMAELDVSHNPLGVSGLRSVLRLLARRTCGLSRLMCDSCGGGSSSSSSTGGAEEFLTTNPGRRYKLDLVRPNHRALLRMMYKTCERHGLQPEEAFVDLVAQPAPYKHPNMLAEGEWPVPKHGKLSFTFSVLGMVRENHASANRNELGSFIERYLLRIRMRLDFRRILPVLAHCYHHSGSPHEQLALLDALSRDFTLEFPQVMALCRDCRLDAGEVLGRLLLCIRGGARARYLATLLVQSVGEYAKLLERVYPFLTFNPDHPTGHYRLRLENPADIAVFERLRLLDLWETSVAQHLELPDRSELGNWSHFRNVVADGQLWGERPFSEWRAPDRCELELDYVGCQRPTAEACALSEEHFAELTAVLSASGRSVKDQVAALRMVAHRLCVSSLQVRELLSIVSDKALQIEVCVLLYFRLVDPQNEKIVRVKVEQDLEQLAQLYARLGHCSFFPIVQPEHENFILDLSIHEQRLSAHALIALAGREEGDNLQNPSYTEVDGTVDPLPLGVPRAWEDVAKIPRSGTFCTRYACAPEQRIFDVRRRLLKNLGLWEVTPRESEVLWWGSLAKVPCDILELLAFLMTCCQDLDRAFALIDGPGGNGVISFSELTKGLARLNCRRFDGPSKTQRLNNIFDFLDGSGERQVSRQEWYVLEQIWRETKLATTEFAQFVDRRFDNDFSAAWMELIAEGQEELREEDFCSAAAKVGFTSSAKPAFMFLDKDGEGTVSGSEFENLKALLPVVDAS